MSYFPNQIMPKTLMKETSKEVDDSPAIENAKDWNTQHREIRAIEKFLIGDRSSGGLILAGADQQGTTQLPKSLKDGVDYVRYVLEELFNGCWLSQYTGTVRYKNYINLPDCVVKTKTTGDISSVDTTITVESTDGFPRSGTITKINGLRTEEYCQSGVSGFAVGPGDICAVGTKYIAYSDFTGAVKHRTSQEIITYTNKNETQFLNCTRSVNGSTSEDLVDEQAIVLSGNASLSISHNFWAENPDSSPHACEVYVSITPDLYVDGGVLKRGTNQVVNHIESFVEVSYTLMLISDFQDIPISDQITGDGSPISNPLPTGGTPNPLSSPTNTQSGFFRLDTMSIFGPFWWYSNNWNSYWFQNNGLAVLPLLWINGTSKTVSYNVSYGENGIENASLNGSNSIPLISDIHPTYARFYNSNPTFGSYNNYNRIEVIFNNYRIYNGLTVANVSFVISGTFMGNKPFYSYRHEWNAYASNIVANLSISDSSSINAKSQFGFPINALYNHDHHNYRLLLNSSNVSYIIPNKTVSGWENYFNI